MKKILLLITLLLFSLPFLAKAESSAQRIYLIEIFYEKGVLNLGEFSTKLGYVPVAEKVLKEIPCRIKIISFSGDVLEEQVFSLSPYVYYDPPREGDDSSLPTGQVEEDKADTLAILPYHNNGKWIELLDANGHFLERKDIGYLARVCGDGVCQGHESFVDCPEDCDAVGADNFCNVDRYDDDPDCVGEKSEILTGYNIEKETEATEKVESSNFLKYIFLGGIGIILIVFFVVMYFMVIKKNREQE